MSKHNIESCANTLPKPRVRNIGYVAACLVCRELYILRWRLYSQMTIRAGGYFYWEKVSKEKSASNYAIKIAEGKHK